MKQDYGLDYGPEQVLASCGGKNALYSLFQAVLDPGDQVLIPAPYWLSYPDMVKLAGAEPVILPCPKSQDFKLRARDLEAAISDKTRLLILNSPSNPTGMHYTRQELKELAQVLLKHPRILIASDDVYYRYLFDGAQWCNLAMAEPELKERTVIANSVSKTYCMTGWRLGYLVGHPDIIRDAAKLQSQSIAHPSSISQYAAAAAMQGDQDEVTRMVAKFDERRQYILERLAAIDWSRGG